MARRKTSAYEEGDPNSKICIIGEAPAKNEVREGRPFVGPSGMVLDQCLHSAGIIRRECYLTNLITHPISNGRSFYYDGKDEGLRPEAYDYAQALEARLRKCKANVFIPVGGLACAALTGKGRIMKWRGSILPTILPEGRKAIPSVHPAATLHGQYIWRYFLISDLKKAKAQSEHPEIALEKRSSIIAPTYAECIEYLASLHKRKEPVSIDIEGSNHQVSCIAFAPNAHQALCIPFKYSGGHYWTLKEEADIWRAIELILMDEAIPIIGQNFIFDSTVLMQKNHIHTRGPIWDTMIAHHIMYPDFPKGLDFLNSLYTDVPYYKDEGKIWQKPFTTDDDDQIFWTYNCKDAMVTYEIWEAINAELNDGYAETYEMTMSLFPVLWYLQLRGVKVDRDSLGEMQKAISREIDETEEKLTEISDYPFSPTSPKQCQEYFYVHKGIKPYVNRSTGRPTTDDKAMQRIWSRHGMPEAPLVQRIRGLKKLSGTYLDVKLDKDERLRCSYNPRGTTTGRLSSSKTIYGTGLNMQNLHPKFKGFIVGG